MAYRAPAIPAKAAEVTKAMSLYLVILMPTDSAAMRLSRIAIMARPERLRIRFRVTVRTTSTRMKPATKVESFVTPVAPMGPLISTLPSTSPKASELFMLKWRPEPSTPT